MYVCQFLRDLRNSFGELGTMNSAQLKHTKHTFSDRS